MTAIAFDLDGTLIDSAPDLHAAALALLDAHGLPPIRFEQTRSFIGNGVPRLVARIAAAAGLPEDTARDARMTAEFMAHYDVAPAARTTLYPGVAAALAALHAAGHPLAICTNKPEAPARVLAAHFGLDRYVSAIVGGDTLAVKKPDPAPLRHALGLIGAAGGLFVGDSEIDAATAQAAGLPFLLYTEGYRKAPVAAIPHDHAFGDFAALPGLVARNAATDPRRDA